MTTKKSSGVTPDQQSQQMNESHNITVGFMRLTASGKAMKLNLSPEDIANCGTYTTKAGKVFVTAVIPVQRVMDVLEKTAEYAGIRHLMDTPADDE